MKRFSLVPMSLSTVVLLLAAPGFARAQVDEPGTVSGNANATISRQPETMRVQIALQGKGAALKDALAAVKSRGDAARKQLTTLGAAKDSIKIDAPKVSEKNDQQQQRQMRMQMMMMQRMKQGGKAASKKAKPAEPILVSAMLTAEWKLDAQLAPMKAAPVGACLAGKNQGGRPRGDKRCRETLGRTGGNARGNGIRSDAIRFEQRAETGRAGFHVHQQNF